jgi:hypothetical protein
MSPLCPPAVPGFSTVPVLRPLAAALLGVALVAGCGGGGKDKETKVTTTGTAGPGVKNDGTAMSLKALLSGAEVVPGPGVKDGVGALLLDLAGTKGCYTLKVTMGEKPTVAHIHQGAKGASGPPVVDLKPPSYSAEEAALVAKSCVDIPADTVAKLIGDPGAYYVNVHSDGHPDGALRGQLARY